MFRKRKVHRVRISFNRLVSWTWSHFSKKYFCHTTYTTFCQSFSKICLSCIFKVINKLKYPASPRTDNQDFMPVLYKICLSVPVGPTISEKSACLVLNSCIDTSCKLLGLCLQDEHKVPMDEIVRRLETDLDSVSIITQTYYLI